MGVVAMEDAILAQLKGAMPRANVDRWPDKFESYDSLPMERGAAVLVAYRGGAFGESRATDAVVQDWTAQFEVQVVTTSLRGPGGATALLDQVRTALTGFRPDNADPLRPVSEEIVNAPTGRQVYGQLYACKRLHIETRPDDTEAPFITATNRDTTTGTAWGYDLATDTSTEVEP